MSDLFDRFPDMKPITSVPSLHTINGVGTTAYGSRDHDPETGTYVKTVWLAFLFIPIIPIGAYRVANAPGGGWYFLGKVPVSGVAKGWALTLLISAISVAAFFAYNHYTSTPAYKAGEQLAEAERLRKQGRLTQSAELCRQVATGATEKSGDGIRAVTAMLDNPELQAKGDATEMAGVFRVARLLRDQPGGIPDKDLVARGLTFVEVRAQDSPDGCLEVLEVVEPAATDITKILEAKRKILEAAVEKQPGNLDLIVKLAVVYEQLQLRDRCLALLEPHAKELGVTEGARILGLIYYDKGKHEEAFALLEPYVDKGLKSLHDAEKAYQTAYDSFKNEVIGQLKDDTAPGFDFKQYDAANQAQQREMLQAYFVKRVNDNADLRKKEEELARMQVVVTAAIDLGMMRLGRAQRATKPTDRKAELELAEKTFRSVQDAAGNRADYQFGLGQVYYWLGKPAEGRKLFDELLKADNRKFETLMLIGELLRQIGSMTEARALLEEAYNQPGATVEHKHEAAMARAITSKDHDDELVWLERSDASMPAVQALLAESRGHKAVREGKDAEAATHYREAVAIYAKQPENPASLNNGGLANLELFRVTGEREALDQGARMLEKALNLQPRDGILAGNTANTYLGVAMGELVGDRIDSRVLKRQAGVGDLEYLYQDADGRKALVQQAKKSAAIAKVRTQFDRALLLAPSNTVLYSNYASVLYLLGDREALAGLERRAADAKIDQTEMRADMRDFLEGKKDDKYRRDAAAAAERAERTVVEARKTGGVTFAVAVGTLVQARWMNSYFGGALDADHLVRLAEEAHQEAPSAGTRSTLQTALLTRAHQRLAAKEPEYAALTKRAGRTLHPSYVIAIALWHDGKLREQALADADVKRALELLHGAAAQLAKQPTDWAWVMLRPAYPDDAARIAEALARNDLLRVDRDLEARLSPPNVLRVLQQCWTLEAAGKTDEGRAALKRCADDGVTLPFDLP